MKKVSKEKEELYNLINSYINENDNLFFADYRGLTVAQFSQLRKKLRENNASMHVVKNRIMKLVLKDKGYSKDLEKFLKGPTAVLTSVGDDTVVVAKDVMNFLKPDEVKLSIKGASIDKEIYDEKSFVEFSKLPTKSELYAKLMGTIQAPIKDSVCIMNNVISKLVLTLQAVVDENKFN